MLAIEELSRVDGSVGIIVAAHTSLCSNHIFVAGNEAAEAALHSAAGHRRAHRSLGADRTQQRLRRRQRALHRHPQGRPLGAQRHQDVHHQRLLRRRRAWSSPSPTKTIGTRGLSAFVVERGTPGFRAGKKENKLGLRASDTSELIFEDCELPAENLLGVEGQGFVDAMRMLDGGRISIAALGLGMATGAYDCALRYSRQRKQFGRPISEFQAIQWKLADMATEIDAARLLTMRAAWLKDHHRKTTLESSMAKLYTSEVAVRAANEAVQIHGGYGFIKDYPAEKFYRDVKLCTIGEGTSEIQRLIIARQILPE